MQELLIGSRETEMQVLLTNFSFLTRCFASELQITIAWSNVGPMTQFWLVYDEFMTVFHVKSLHFYY